MEHSLGVHGYLLMRFPVRQSEAAIGPVKDQIHRTALRGAVQPQPGALLNMLGRLLLPVKEHGELPDAPGGHHPLLPQQFFPFGIRSAEQKQSQQQRQFPHGRFLQFHDMYGEPPGLTRA